MNLILDLLFPKNCVGCKKEGSYFCQNCVADILQTDLICPECDNLSIGGLTHPSCEKSFGLDGLWSLGIYKGSLKRAIQKLKYEPSLVKDFAPVLADITVEYWMKYSPYLFDLIKKNQDKWVIIPVPLHWFRENNRGFNQAKLIGQILSKKLGLAYSDALKRIRFTKSQAKLKKKDRSQNIRNAFAISPDCNPALPAGRLSPVTCVLLIDDVWTTGSTLRECCFVLKRNGAKSVWALTLAR